ncbi:MAG: peptidase Ste24p [Conexibacter sp.]|nr:peptidase Ste24p [Conexibacter sp.]
MVVTVVLTPALVVALLIACVVVMPVNVLSGMALAALLGLAAVLAERGDAPSAQLVGAAEEPELHGIVARLCVAADLPQPEIAVDAERQPNSWIVDLPGRPARLHVTRGLLELLDPAELEAVVAHELSHVAHRDATVMTVVGLPGAILLHGGGGFGAGWAPMMAGRVLTWIIGFLAGIGSNALSRYRELTADAGAAALTGRPSALASALMKVSGDLVHVRAEDLRAVAGRDALHLLPVDEARGWQRALHATHPSVARRIAALERLERELQHARPPLRPPGA